MKGLIRDLKKLIGGDKVFADPCDLHSYASDATHYFAWKTPDVVALPETTDQVSRILKYANKQKVPVTPRGAGSGISAGCTPIMGGIVLDMKRMRRIIEINRGNMTAKAECGVVLADFHRAVEKERLFYPPDPQSMEVCTLGGNVATRAGGPHGVKYGTTQNYVLGLTAALADGEVIETGGACVKQSVGYDLTHLLTGSEGTLGVITTVNLRLLPLPPARRTVVVECKTLDQTAELVSEIIVSGVTPAKLELMFKGAAGLMNKYLPRPFGLNGEAYLLIELDGGPAQVEEEAGRVADVCRRMKVIEARVVEHEAEAQSYWLARKSLYPIMLSRYKKIIAEDVTVPRDRVPAMVRKVEDIAESVGIEIGLGGHAGDGNIHPLILFPELSEELDEKAEDAIARIVEACLSLGGTLSGEHGIGLHKARFLAMDLGENQVELMKRIKKAFDPRGIMNPGKIWERGGGE